MSSGPDAPTTTPRDRTEAALVGVAISGGITLRVSGSYCRDLRDGQELYLHVKPGFLNTPWVSHYDVMRNVEKEVEPD